MIELSWLISYTIIAYCVAKMMLSYFAKQSMQAPETNRITRLKLRIAASTIGMLWPIVLAYIMLYVILYSAVRAARRIVLYICNQFHK